MDAAVVTGAAGALGGAVVDELLARGTAVVAMDRSSGRLTALGAREGVHAVAVDLAQRAAVQAAFAEVDALAVTPTALVAVAGAFAPGDLSNVDEDGFEAMWRTNVASALWSAQGAAPLLARSGGGAIVTVGSKVTITGTGLRRVHDQQGRRRPAHHAAGRRTAAPGDPGQRRAAFHDRHPRQPHVDAPGAGGESGGARRDREGDRLSVQR